MTERPARSVELKNRTSGMKRNSHSPLQLFVGPSTVPILSRRPAATASKLTPWPTVLHPTKRQCQFFGFDEWKCDDRHHVPSTKPTRIVQPTVGTLGERALGVDYGARRIGLAVSVGVHPRTLPVLSGFSCAADAARKVNATAMATVCDTIVVGLPVRLRDGGAHGLQVEQTRTFIAELTAAAPWARIYSLDERLTTHQARDRLKLQPSAAKDSPKQRKIAVDSIAAAILLERYFDDQDSMPVLIQQGSANGCVLPVDRTAAESNGQEREERIGFAEWKQNAMLRAQQNALDLTRTKAKQRPKRKSK